MDLSRFLKSNAPAKSAPAAADPRALRGEGEAIAASVANFLSRTGLFDREAYVRAYPDVAKSGLDPLHHFMRVGIHAGRNFTSLETIARLWREVLRESQGTDDSLPEPLADPTRYRVAIYVSSLGNFFMTEIGEVLKAGFTDAGVPVSLFDEKSAPDAKATHHVVVAPHEFFVLGEGRRWATDEFVSRAVLFSTEQIQTQWFARSLVFLTRAKAVADMNGQNAAILRKAGIRAVPIQAGYSPSFAPFAGPEPLDAPAFRGLSAAVRNFEPSERFADRPLDVLFLGQQSRRREQLLAAFAEKFADMNTFLYYSRATRPLSPADNPMAASEVTAALLQRSKVLLNLHRDEYTYFEWWRLMQAFWHKAAVVTEACFPHPIYKPGVHYFEESPRHIHHLIEWLAKSVDGQTKAEVVRENAYRMLRERSSARTAAIALLRAGETA